MYKKKFTYKDMNNNNRTDEVCFYLFEREVFKLLVPLQTLMLMTEKLSAGEELRELDTAEVVEYYTLFEEILLKAYGEITENGAGFSHDGAIIFEESCLFNACMMEFVSTPQEVRVLLDKLMPSGLQTVVKNADVNMLALSKEETTTPELVARIAQLRADLAQAEGETTPTTE